MPAMPTARMATPIKVPHTLTRPGLIVVEPRKEHASDGSQESRRDKRGDGVALDRNAVQRRGPGVGANSIEIAADRQMFEHEPQDEREPENVKSGDGQAKNHSAVQRQKSVRQTA